MTKRKEISRITAGGIHLLGNPQRFSRVAFCTIEAKVREGYQGVDAFIELVTGGTARAPYAGYSTLSLGDKNHPQIWGIGAFFAPAMTLHYALSANDLYLAHWQFSQQALSDNREAINLSRLLVGYGDLYTPRRSLGSAHIPIDDFLKTQR